MALDFPSSPTVGNTYSVGSPARTWRWNGEGWERFINAGQIVAYVVIFEPVVEASVGGLSFIPDDIYTFTYL